MSACQFRTKCQCTPAATLASNIEPASSAAYNSLYEYNSFAYIFLMYYYMCLIQPATLAYINICIKNNKKIEKLTKNS
jgi:hypothetical protein